MAKGLSPTQRTLQALRELGCVACVVEKFNQFGGKFGIRQDMFGIIDIVSLDVIDTIGIQACSTDLKAHYDKLTVERAEQTIEWLRSPYRKLFIYSWRKIKLNRGGKAMRWSAKIREITMKDLLKPETCEVPF